MEKVRRTVTTRTYDLIVDENKKYNVMFTTFEAPDEIEASKIGHKICRENRVRFVDVREVESKSETYEMTLDAFIKNAKLVVTYKTFYDREYLSKED